MSKQNKGRAKRIKNLIVVSSLSAIILAVSTYAWFVGMRSVNVSSFDISIAAADSLLLSFDGNSWSYEVSISKATLEENSYVGHTNSWGGDGLIPMSTIGEMDVDASRMKLYEKASYTPTPGGYRLMSSRVNNYRFTEDVLEPEQDGYVVFDLFVRNFSGTQYIEELNELDEEAIYLTVDSEVTVAADGVADTGIENSVRVAFAQIGRVSGFTTDDTIITEITCSDDSVNKITGICRTAQIWEPNDRDHVGNAIRWYEKSCLQRDGDDVSADSYTSDNCLQVIDGIAYPTYAVSKPISSDDAVDIYDGPVYNTYVPEPPKVSPLVAYSYFSDTMKLLRGTSRPQFMTLAPNSITKVRVYVYIEGQDIDNYDFSSIGKRIAVKFGFTKQRFTEDDIEYERLNPSNNIDINEGLGPDGSDMTVPVITLLPVEEGNPGEGDLDPVTITKGEEYIEPGATAEDNIDGNITNDIVITGTVNTNVPNTYLVVYKVQDSMGNIGTKTRTIIVVDDGL
jgi:hypothetical protein